MMVQYSESDIDHTRQLAQCQRYEHRRQRTSYCRYSSRNKRGIDSQPAGEGQDHRAQFITGNDHLTANGSTALGGELSNQVHRRLLAASYLAWGNKPTDNNDRNGGALLPRISHDGDRYALPDATGSRRRWGLVGTKR